MIPVVNRGKKKGLLGLDVGAIDVVDFLSSLGVRNVRLAGDEVSYSCPFSGHSHGDSSPSASMNVDTTAFYCFGCHAKGNAVTFLSIFDGISPVRAAFYIRERYAGGWKEPVGSVADEIEGLISAPQVVLEQAHNKIIDERFALDFSIVWSLVAETESAHEDLTYPLRRGLSAETLTRFEFGYDEMSRRTTLAIRDRHGNLVGFKGRDVTGTHGARYLVLGGNRYGFDPYKAALIVWGAHDVKPDAGRIILAEGEWNAVKLRQLGYPAVSAGSSTFSNEQASLVASLCSEVVLFYDSDNAGQIGERQAADALCRKVKVLYVPEHEGDPMDMDSGAVETLLKNTLSHTTRLIGV